MHSINKESEEVQPSNESLQSKPVDIGVLQTQHAPNEKNWERAKQILSVAKAMQQGREIGDSADALWAKHHIDQRRATDTLDTIVEQAAQEVRVTREKKLRSELPLRQAEATTLEAKVGSPLTPEEILRVINNLERNNAVRLKDIEPINKMQASGKTMSEIRAEAQAQFDARQRTEDIIAVLEGRLVDEPTQEIIDSRQRNGESTATILAKARENLERNDAVRQQKEELKELLKKIEEIAEEIRKIEERNKQQEVATTQHTLHNVRHDLAALASKHEVPATPKHEAKRLLSEKIVLDKKEPFTIADLGYGSADEASPHHAIQDVHGTSIVKNDKGEVVAARFISIDGSGGALNGFQMSKDQKERLIKEKADKILRGLQAQTEKPAEDALRTVDNIEQKDHDNPAFAAGVVVDVYTDSIDIARKGDQSVVLWKPQGYAHRRGEAWGANRGEPSPFQSIDIPQNVMYFAKAAGDQSKTVSIEDDPRSNYIITAVGSEGEIRTTTIARDPADEEYLLILSDGARGSGTLLEPTGEYSKQVQVIMENLHANKIGPREAAQLITQAARAVPGESDDITVQIVTIPPSKK